MRKPRRSWAGCERCMPTHWLHTSIRSRIFMKKVVRACLLHSHPLMPASTKPRATITRGAHNSKIKAVRKGCCILHLAQLFTYVCVCWCVCAAEIGWIEEVSSSIMSSIRRLGSSTRVLIAVACLCTCMRRERCMGVR